ncbi:hypothetical protein KIN20_036789 [Parelaphostrongylus tenuis]|nr:hypothetical protein KIN20_036789 [Parelaphostrongylus tenuis]
MSVAQIVADIADKVDKKVFKTQVLPLIKDYVESALTRSSVEFVYLALLLKDRFPSYIAEIVSFVEKDGSCRFSESDLAFLLLTVKKCDSSALEPFLKLLLASSRQSGLFSVVYRNVVEKWCTSGDELKVLERIFYAAKLTLSSCDEAHKEILTVFSPFLLKRIVQVAHGKRNAQNRILREKIVDFCKFVETFLSSTEDDSGLLEVIELLDTTESFDSLTGSDLIVHLIERLSQDGVAKWMQQSADKAWSLRYVCTAFPHWSNDTKVEAISTLLQRPRSEELQHAVGNCISSLFKMKVRAGAWVSVSLVDGGEDVLRQVVKTILGKHVVKKAIKKLDGSICYKKTLLVFWMCLNLWSKAASSDEISEGYSSNAEELFMVVRDGEESLKVLLDQLMALLSEPLKYHRTVVYYVFVHCLEYIKDEHIYHIIQTLMMNDEQLIDGQGSDTSSSSNEDNGVHEHAGDMGSESDSSNNDEVMDTETLNRLESSLGKGAVKRKSDAIDEEESDMSDVGDAEMFEMDDRLAAAFKSLVPKKENKLTAQLASAFRLKLADLLLFALSSSSTPATVKIHMTVPLLKLAKLQLKQNPESQNFRKTKSLLKIISHLKKIHMTDEEVVSLLDQLVEECVGISNPVLVSTAAALSSFVFSLGISSDGIHSETVLSAFVGLFERFMTQEDGLIGSELAVAAIVKHPEAFVSKSKVFLLAGFNEEYRIFRRTEALLCLSTIMGKNVLCKVPVEKSVVKGIAKASSRYFSASLSHPETIKPRFFASVLKLLLSVTKGVPDEYKYLLQKYLTECLTEDERWIEVSKRIHSASQQVCGKSPASVLRQIRKSLA